MPTTRVLICLGLVVAIVMCPSHWARGVPNEDRDDPGAKKGLASDKQAARMGRWHLVVRYDTGAQYLAKLKNLQAMVAFEIREDQFELFSDLSEAVPKGKKASPDDLRKLERLFWVSKDSEGIAALAGAMNVRINPISMMVFFPRELEDELLKSELSYARMTEAQINERKIQTSFHAERQGDKWIVKVLDQRRIRKQ